MSASAALWWSSKAKLIDQLEDLPIKRLSAQPLAHLVPAWGSACSQAVRQGAVPTIWVLARHAVDTERLPDARTSRRASANPRELSTSPPSTGRWRAGRPRSKAKAIVGPSLLLSI